MFFSTALLAAALIVGFYMAWNIGANDVANAFGTSVGSGAITFLIYSWVITIPVSAAMAAVIYRVLLVVFRVSFTP